jgi:hypothetical protein
MAEIEVRILNFDPDANVASITKNRDADAARRLLRLSIHVLSLSDLNLSW